MIFQIVLLSILRNDLKNHHIHKNKADYEVHNPLLLYQNFQSILVWITRVLWFQIRVIQHFLFAKWHQ